MAKTVITLEENADGQSIVYVEQDENQKGFLKGFADYVVQKARLGDNVLVVRRGLPAAPAPVVQYVDRVVEKVVEKVVYKDAPAEQEEKAPTKIVSHVKRVLHGNKK